MVITKDQIVEAVAEMSVMDVIKLITAMEEKFGISATNLPVGCKPGVVDEAENNSEDKTEFDVILKAAGTNKIAVIKAVRSTTGLGLKDAKDLVESAPKVLKERISKNEAEALKKSLEQSGAEVEVK